MSALALAQLKTELAGQLVEADRLKRPEGVPTGHRHLDRFLLSRGLPKGALSYLHGIPGSGALGLWCQTAAMTTRRGLWVAWLGQNETQLCPWILRQASCDFSKLLVVSAPQNPEQRLWILQELMSLGLFELIGCDLGKENLRLHQIAKLKQIARQQQTALCFLAERAPVVGGQQMALLAQFEAQQIRIDRALHRPTPQLMERSHSYADFVPQLTQNRASRGR